ncbi:MAG TPA: hypothetical protein VFS21_03160, partial [Roseiflexaceae bacterium]|nr:hypothetical protein [Roseiflexaceae bacterium]
MTQSTFTQIRSLLDEAERLIVVMHETPDGVLRVIRQVDEIDRLLAALADPVYDTRAEESRAEALRERLVRESDRTVRLVRTGGFAEQLADSPIWQRASAAQQERQRRQRRTLVTAGVVLGLAAVLLFVVVPWLFPPTPIANTEAIARRVFEQDLPGAIEQARAEQARAPEDPLAPIWLGALYEQQGDGEAAEAAW